MCVNIFFYYQVENGILLPSLRPMLHLLDLHNVKRLDFHNSIMEELRDKLITQITELGAKEGRDRDRKLKELLTKSFPVIKIKALRPVVMCILKHMAHVEDKYLKILVSVPLLKITFSAPLYYNRAVLCLLPVLV